MTDYYNVLRRFPENFEEAYNSGRKHSIIVDGGLLICGMGGSAVAGDFVKTLSARTADFPVLVNRDYSIPKFVDKTWSVVLISYSGNTEETLSAYSRVVERGCAPICITSGGMLQSMASDAGIPVVRVSDGLQPRDAFFHIFGSLLGIVSTAINFHLEDQFLTGIAKARDYLFANGDEIKTRYKALIGKQIMVLTSVLFAPVGYRFRCQLNENSKLHAAEFVAPEFSHNGIIGFDGMLSNNVKFVIIRSSYEDRRTSLHLDFVEGLTQAIVEKVKGNLFVQLLSIVATLDYASIALALEQGLDPHSIPSIVRLKQFLNSTK